MTADATQADEHARPRRSSRVWVVVEVALVLVVFFVYAGSAIPGTNEAHYLARSKHFWNPDWCSRDLFLASPEAHPVFHRTFGWLTRFCDLPTTAVIGRVVGWLLIAIGWVRLSRKFIAAHGKSLDQRLVSVLTATLAVVLWDRAHMAGEWVIGGFEAKVLSFAFVFFAMGEVTAGRWRTGTVLAGIGTAFHPLVGGWALIAMAWSWLFDAGESDERNGRCQQTFWARFKYLLPALIVAAIFSLIGVWPALGLDAGADRLTHLGARRIYVHWRLGHHLVPFRSVVKAQMSWHFIARHAVFVVAWLALWRYSPRVAARDRLQRIVAGCVLIALLGAVIEWVTMANWIYQTAWMRYYWYRMTDALVPIGFSLGLMAWIVGWLQSEASGSKGKGEATLAVVLLLVSASLVTNVLQRRADPRPPADQQGRLRHGTAADQQAEHRDWLQLCRWCRESTDASALFMTPTYFQTFKWYAERAEVASWKDVPQGAVGLVEWQDRRRMARRTGLYSEDSPAEFLTVQKELAPYDTDYVIVQLRWGPVRWQRPPIFRNASFEIYALK